MKNLLICLVILSSLVSCGKKNTVAGVSNGLTSPISASNSVESGFISKVTSNQFGTGMFNPYQTYNQAIAQGANPKYHYSNYAATAVSPNCHDAWIFRVCNTSYSSSPVTPTLAREVINSSVNVTERQNLIISIYNKKVRVDTNGMGGYRIITNDGKTYFFETALPIQANPTQTYNADGSGEYWYEVVN